MSTAEEKAKWIAEYLFESGAREYTYEDEAREIVRKISEMDLASALREGDRPVTLIVVKNQPNDLRIDGAGYIDVRPEGWTRFEHFTVVLDRAGLERYPVGTRFMCVAVPK